MSRDLTGGVFVNGGRPATVEVVNAGWWVRLEGEERDLRDLAMHFSAVSLDVVEEDGAFWLGSSDFSRFRDPEKFGSVAARSSPSLRAHSTSSSAASRLRASRRP